ncbi:hypothetical protein, partial [Enterococcus faecalis]|uniref:hypothetical protein n=1 Tax=Enterococcus faecalis TaxID=1351 RepID=UPI00403F0C58
HGAGHRHRGQIGTRLTVNVARQLDAKRGRADRRELIATVALGYRTRRAAALHGAGNAEGGARRC